MFATVSASPQHDCCRGYLCFCCNVGKGRLTRNGNQKTGWDVGSKRPVGKTATQKRFGRGSEAIVVSLAAVLMTQNKLLHFAGTVAR